MENKRLVREIDEATSTINNVFSSLMYEIDEKEDVITELKEKIESLEERIDSMTDEIEGLVSELRNLENE